MDYDVPLIISWFPTGKPKGRAIGDPEHITWGNFVDIICSSRREGEKDGPNFIAARFKFETDGKHVRRLGVNLLGRTAITMDCEFNKQTSEHPPPLEQAVTRIRNAGWGAVAYTSHNHRPAAPRYRIGLPLSEEIDHELPAVEIIAERLGLTSVVDRSKLGANSPFYLPSCAPGEADQHDVAVIAGAPIDAAWLRDAAGKLLAQRHAEQDRIAAVARDEAAKRWQTKLDAGGEPDDGLIEKIRANLDLEHLLLSHGYDKRGTKFRHPNSTSGIHGADIKAFAGIERVYSHNANDTLHRNNLPAWCTVAAIDAFDTVVILDFGGNRKQALRELAERYNLTPKAERKAIAHLAFRFLRANYPPERAWSELCLFANTRGVSTEATRAIAEWCVQQWEYKHTDADMEARS